MPSRYRSLSGAWVDAEKQRLHAADDSDSDVPNLTSSSRNSSASYPMLGQPSAPSFAYHLPRRRFTRYFTCLIGGILIFFIVFLVNGASTSRTEVALGLKKASSGPAAWEQFPFLKRYHGGIRTLVSREGNVPEYPVAEDVEAARLAEEQKRREDAMLKGEKGFEKRSESAWREKAVRYDPYSNDNATASGEEWRRRRTCYLDQKTKLQAPGLLAYKGITDGFPEPIMGSYETLGMRNDVCFERHGRLGPYGYGYSRKFGGSGAGLEGDREGADEVWPEGEGSEIDWREVDWADAQEACRGANIQRFRPAPKSREHSFKTLEGGVASSEAVSTADSIAADGKNYLNRTAVLIRTWHDYQYDAEDLFYLRALVNELSIQSGAEYEVHFLVHVKDDNKQIWADDGTYQQVLNDALPREFRGMGTLWSERQMGLIYGGVHESNYRGLPVHGAYRSTYMPVQYFAHMHPEYDFFWHWEMDVRYTGHFYELFTQVGRWAKQQPRKGLWERNARFYVPSEHGTWEEFKQLVRVQIEHGTASKSNVYAGTLGGDANAAHPLDKASRRPETPVWGPLLPTGEGDTTDLPDSDPKPPTTYDTDHYTWGVSEEADFITFNPLFDPSGTNWILAEDVTGYNTTASFPPRRTAIITASRLSRRLLETMHRETTLHRHTMFSEMWPGSIALHHGYKAVYAPHPVYIDRAWPSSYLAAIFNNGRNGASGGARTSVFSDERQHNFLGTTWYYHAGFSANLWKRWLGYKVDNDGGEEEEMVGEGRMCLPGMLLHPVKGVEMIFEHQEGEV